MSHTNNYAKYDPYVAEIAAKVDAILEQYDDVLGNVQVPFNVGQAMVKAHERGEKSKFEAQLAEYQAFVSEHAVGDSAWERTLMYYSHKRVVRDMGRNMTNWFEFTRHVKDMLTIMHDVANNNGNMQVVYYSMVDM